MWLCVYVDQFLFMEVYSKFICSLLYSYKNIYNKYIKQTNLALDLKVFFARLPYQR